MSLDVQEMGTKMFHFQNYSATRPSQSVRPVCPSQYSALSVVCTVTRTSVRPSARYLWRSPTFKFQRGVRSRQFIHTRAETDLAVAIRCWWARGGNWVYRHCTCLFGQRTFHKAIAWLLLLLLPAMYAVAILLLLLLLINQTRWIIMAGCLLAWERTAD